MQGIDVIKKGLARKIGPMANIILEEHASGLGERLDSFPEEKIPRLLLSLRGEPDILEEVEALVRELQLEKAPPAPSPAPPSIPTPAAAPVPAGGAPAVPGQKQTLEVLEGIKRGARGVVGSFALARGGKLLASDMPELLREEVQKLCYNISFLVDQIVENRKLEKIQIAAETGHIFIASNGEVSVGCMASKEANLGLVDILVKKALVMISKSA
ncbi:MAG: hypothetical protein AABX40_04710 [Candidatus Hydrothermarchaeota archaeon]